MCSVVTHGDFVSVGTDDNKEDSCYIVKFNYDNYTIKKDVIIDGRIISIGEQVGNDCYPNSFRQG